MGQVSNIVGGWIADLSPVLVVLIALPLLAFVLGLIANTIMKRKAAHDAR
jgi:uncharacterized membrane protein YoaK (UPF0700 family)